MEANFDYVKKMSDSQLDDIIKSANGILDALQERKKNAVDIVEEYSVVEVYVPLLLLATAVLDEMRRRYKASQKGGAL